MSRRLYWAAAAWSAYGLFIGIFYRSLTHSRDFTGSTQLSVAHTHAFALGTLFLLIILGLNEVIALESHRRFRIMFWTWNLGLIVTSATLVTKGTLQVIQSAAADSPAIAGISGIGHIALTVAFGLFFWVLRASEKRLSQTRVSSGG